MSSTDPYDLSTERALIAATAITLDPARYIPVATEILRSSTAMAPESALECCHQTFTSMLGRGAIEVIARQVHVRLEHASLDTQIRIRRRQEDWNFDHVGTGWPSLPPLANEARVPLDTLQKDVADALLYLGERKHAVPHLDGDPLLISEVDLLAVLPTSMQGPFRAVSSISSDRSLVSALLADGALDVSARTFRNGVTFVEWRTLEGYSAAEADCWTWPVLQPTS